MNDMVRSFRCDAGVFLKAAIILHPILQFTLEESDDNGAK